MKLIPLNISHKLTYLDDLNLNVPVHLHTNRLEGNINLNGLTAVTMFEENQQQKIMLAMNYVDIRISLLKRHKKILDNWLADCNNSLLKPKDFKKHVVFEGLYDRIECYGAYIATSDLSKSQEFLSITCDKMIYVVETQVVAKKMLQLLETRL